MANFDSDRYATEFGQTTPKVQGLKSRIRALARHGALSTLGRFATLDQRPFLRLLFCHYVFDDQIEAFRQTLTTIQEWGQFVDTETCVGMIKETASIDSRYFHLSFDDGFRNVIQNAVPILDELGISASLFVSTSMIRADLETTNYGGVVEYATWEDLRTVVSRGIQVGSHTRTHARTSELDTDRALEDEIAGSKRDIEDHLKVECKYLSWPFGSRRDVSERSLEVARQAGYEACFGAFRGSVSSGGDVDPYFIPRHHFELEWPMSHIRYFSLGNRER